MNNQSCESQKINKWSTNGGKGKTRRRKQLSQIECTQVRALDLCRRPVSPPPVWLRTALRLTLLVVDLFTFQSIRTSSTLTTPELRLHV